MPGKIETAGNRPILAQVAYTGEYVLEMYGIIPNFLNELGVTADRPTRTIAVDTGGILLYGKRIIMPRETMVVTSYNTTYVIYARIDMTNPDNVIYVFSPQGTTPSGFRQDNLYRNYLDGIHYVEVATVYIPSSGNPVINMLLDKLTPNDAITAFSATPTGQAYNLDITTDRTNWNVVLSNVINDPIQSLISSKSGANYNLTVRTNGNQTGWSTTLTDVVNDPISSLVATPNGNDYDLTLKTTRNQTGWSTKLSNVINVEPGDTITNLTANQSGEKNYVINLYTNKGNFSTTLYDVIGGGGGGIGYPVPIAMMMYADVENSAINDPRTYALHAFIVEFPTLGFTAVASLTMLVVDFWDEMYIPVQVPIPGGYDVIMGSFDIFYNPSTNMLHYTNVTLRKINANGTVTEDNTTQMNMLWWLAAGPIGE